VLTFDRRAGRFMDRAAVEARFGVPPESIPDWLALVGDAPDGYPGLPGWGARSTAAVLQRYPHLEDIPDRVSAWDVGVRGAATLAATLHDRREEALLYRELATLRLDAPVPQRDPGELRWRGPDPVALADLAIRLRAPGLADRLPRPRG
jgi:5'-3' exonuclease